MSVAVDKQLLDALKKIDRPGTFCTSGRLPPLHPGLEVAEIGPISLPIEKRQATALKKLARQAPYGKGTQTLVDTDVRRVWEIDAEQVALTNPEWKDAVNQAIVAVQSDLGLEKQQLEAHLYKLLLYEPGSFFLAHRDGEKLDRMVATLVIALPTLHAGGELVVRHEGQEITIDFGPDSRFHTQFAAFYADCEHEVRLVTSGFRLALVYNLTLVRSKCTVTAPQSGEHIEKLALILEQWKGKYGQASGPQESTPPTKLAILLEHQYSPAGLTFDTLKGIDRAKAKMLFAAAARSGYDSSVAIVTYWETGSAEPSGEYYPSRRSRHRYDDYEDEDYENEEDESDGEHIMGEVFDESLQADYFSDADGRPLNYSGIPLSKGELVSETPLNEWKPDQEEFEGYTGNAGMTLERWYHHAAVMLWPAEFRFDVLCEAGVESVVSGLDQMVRQFQDAPKSKQSALQQSCLDFANRIISYWPEKSFGYGARHQSGADSESATGRPHLLQLLATLDDTAVIAAWLRGVMAKDVSVDPGKSVGALCELHGWETFQEELLHLFRTTTNETLERHALLLEDLSLRKTKKAKHKQLCVSLAEYLVSAVEAWNPKDLESNWQARRVNCAELLPPLVKSFATLQAAEQLDRLTTCIVTRAKEFDLTTVQIPALLQLEKWLNRNIKRRNGAIDRWLTAMMEELESRASNPPPAPADWRRVSATGCTCADCRELSRFLNDPAIQTQRFPMNEGRRQHLHNVIDGKGLDTTHVTTRTGSPYVLVCTKTTASYDRLLKAHHVDLEHLAKVRQITDWHAGLPTE